MFGSDRLLGHYSLVASDLDYELDSNMPQHALNRQKLKSKRRLVFIILTSLICLATSFTSGILLNRWIASGSRSRSVAVSTCNRPQFRREWRSLSHLEKRSYIQAVQCLKKTPSRLGLNQSLYDDFPYVHFRVGGYCMFLSIFDNRHQLI